MDIGAGEHVCRSSFAPTARVDASRVNPALGYVHGEGLDISGSIVVPMTPGEEDEIAATTEFQAANWLTDDTLSVGNLMRKGYRF